MARRDRKDRTTQEPGEAWGLALLAADRVGRRLPRESRLSAVRAALSLGREAAQRCRAAHETHAPVVLAGQLDVPVCWSAEAPTLGAMLRIAEYQPRPPLIRLFTESVRAIVRAEGSLPIPEIYVAHELFHHLEATTLAPASRLARVTLARLGPWTWGSGVRALSEIAAHAFAQTLLELPCFPGVLDRLAASE
jgi:hypothetical protein